MPAAPESMFANEPLVPRHIYKTEGTRHFLQNKTQLDGDSRRFSSASLFPGACRSRFDQRRFSVVNVPRCR